jgi:hypothetical protein
MNKHRVLLFLVLLTLFSFKGYDLSGSSDSTRIILKVTNNNRPAMFILSYETDDLLFTPWESKRITMSADGTEEVKFNANIPVRFSLFGNINGVKEGMVFPGDSLLITCDLRKDGSRVDFEGPSASISYFLDSLNKTTLSDLYYNQKATPDNYLPHFFHLEKKYLSIDSFYKNYKKPLPPWFIHYSDIGLSYDKAMRKLSLILSINSQYPDKLYANPELLLWFRDVELNNPKAVDHPEYFEFLWNYFLWRNGVIVKNENWKRVDLNWFNKVIALAQEELSAGCREWFISEVIRNYYVVSDYEDVDKVSAQAKLQVKSQQYIKQINDAREQSVEMRKARFAKSARVGDKAPGFYLKDSLNQNYSVDRFRGKWVLLSFLDSENFQEGNFASLVNTYAANKDHFELVNIYTDYDKLYWGKIIGKLPPSGVHLFCKGNWTDRLTNLYGLERFPYYVLVDPDGIIRYSRPGIFSDALPILNVNK